MITRKAVSLFLALTVILSALCSVAFSLSATADSVGTPPDPAEDYEQKQVTVFENFLNAPGDNAFADWTKLDITDVPDVPLAPSFKAKILQASSTTGNNDFYYISSTKKTGLPADKTGLIFTMWVRYTPKAGVSDTLTQNIRFQCAEAVENGSGGYAKGDTVYGDMTVTGNGTWQYIELPVSNMTGSSNLDGVGIWTVTFTSLKGNTFVADDLIEFADIQVQRTEWVKKNGGKGAYPGEDYEESTGAVMTDFLNGPVSNAFSTATLVDVTDIPDISQAKSFHAKVLKASSTTANEDMWRYISSTKKNGFTSDTRYWSLTLWTRYTPKAGVSAEIKQTVRLSFVEAKEDSTQASGYNKDDTVYGDMTVIGDGEWHKVTLPVADLVGGANLADGTGVWTMTFQSLVGNSFAADDVVEFANIQFEQSEWVLKNNGMGAYPGADYEEGTEVVLSDFLNVPGSNAFATWEKLDITDIPNVVLAAGYKATLLRNSSTTANDGFQYISSTTKEGLPEETRYLSLTLWARYNPTSGVSSEVSQNIRVNLREAIEDGSTASGYNGGDTIYGDITVTGDGEWHKFTLPVADMIGGSNLDGTGVWTMTFQSLKGNTFVTDDVIEFANIQFEKPVWVLKNNGMGECPSEDYEAGYVTVLQDFLNLPASNDFADITREVTASLPDGITAYNYIMELKQNSGTTANNDFRYISTTKKDGLPVDKDYMYVSFWARYTPESGTEATQKIRMNITESVLKDDGSGDHESGDRLYGDFEITGNGEWTKVEIPLSDMVGSAKFDGDGVWTVTFTSLLGNTFAVGDKLEIASVEFRKPAWVLKNDGMGAAPSEDHMIGQEIYWNNSATLIQRIVKESLSMTHEIVSIDEASIDSTKAYKTTFGDASDFNEHKLYYMFYPDATNVNEGIDMSEVMDEMRVGFWFKTPEGRDNMTFRLVLFDNKWVGYLNKDFVITKGGEWQYVEIKFSDMTPYREIVADNMGRMEIRLADTENGLADGESLYITDIRMFTRKWVLKPDLYEDDLSKYDNPYKANANVLFAHEADDTAVTDGAVTVKETEAKNGEYFNFAREITPTAAPDSGDWSVILGGDTVNLLDVYETAALRLFLKSPKANVRVVVGLVDSSGNKLTTNVLIEKKDVWQEIQIRPSVLKAAGFDRTAIAGVVIGSEYKASHSDKYLLAGQKLLVGGIEIYDNSPSRKHAEKVYTQTIAEAIDSNFLLLPGSYGTGIDIRPDYVNLMNKRSTWQIYLRRDSKKGISLGIPLPQEWDLSDYKDFGYLTFAVASNRYTSINLEITDGESTYTQDITAAEDWMEYRVYFHDIAAAGVNTAKIEEITIVRNRTIGEGCVINVTELTACSDLYDIEYLSESVKEETVAPPADDTQTEAPSDDDTLSETPIYNEPADDTPSYEDSESVEDEEEVVEPEAVTPPSDKKDTSAKETPSDSYLVVYIIGAAVLILGAALAGFLIIRKRKATNKKG